MKTSTIINMFSVRILVTCILFSSSLALVAKETKKAEEAGVKRIEKLLNETIVAAVKVEDARLSTLMELMEWYGRRDGVKFSLKLPKGAKEPTVTLNRETVTIRALLEDICNQTGLTFMITDKGIVVGNFNTKKTDKSMKQVTEK